MKAQRDLLRGKNYGNADLEYAFRRWSGGLTNGKPNGKGYGVEVVPTDLRGKKLKDMTDAELDRVIQNQIRREGWKEGKIYA